MIMLVTALGGCWTVEQPAGSVLNFYPSWRETTAGVFRCGGWGLQRCQVGLLLLLSVKPLPVSYNIHALFTANKGSR